MMIVDRGFLRPVIARPGSFAIDEPLGALRVEAMRPVAQRLPVHGSNLGGGLAVFSALAGCDRPRTGYDARARAPQ
jgi:hypothetical protein